jgi:ankyrin repeat protein
VQDNYAFRWAAAAGHIYVLRFLLPLPGIDPAAQNNKAFRSAAYYSHLDVLRFLLPLPGVDPTAQDNEAFRLAKSRDHNEVVAFLEHEQLLASGAIEYPEELVELDNHMETDAALVVYQYLSYSCVPGVERAHRQRLRALLRQR